MPYLYEIALNFSRKTNYKVQSSKLKVQCLYYFSILMMYSLMKLAPGCRLFIMYLSLNSPVYSAQSQVPNQG